MTRRLGFVPLLLATLLVPVRPLPAQQRGGATILASATVVTDRLSVAALRPLAFETTRPVHAATVDPTDRAAAQWALVGQANTQVQINFTLPSELVNLQTPQAPGVPVAFSRAAGRWRQEVNDPDAAASFDPRQGAAVRFRNGTSPTVYVWLGGTVSPTASTAPGTYQGTVTLTLFYY